MSQVISSYKPFLSLNEIIQSKWMSMLIIPLLAAFVYGSWAAYANSEYAFIVVLKAGLGQASYAFVSTLLVTEMTKRTCVYFGMGAKGFLISFFSTFCLMLSIPLTVHAYLSTPDTWQAILPGLVWGTIYIFIVLVFFTKNVSLNE